MFVSHSAEETMQYGEKLAKQLKKGSILCLCGDLGAGKTTLIKGIAKGLGNCSEREVTSPTFSYLHIYEGKIPLYHFDLYRLKNGVDFCALGFDEFLEKEGICCIEWAEKIESLLPPDKLTIHVSHEGQQARKIHGPH